MPLDTGQATGCIWLVIYPTGTAVAVGTVAALDWSATRLLVGAAIAVLPLVAFFVLEHPIRSVEWRLGALEDRVQGHRLAHRAVTMMFVAWLLGPPVIAAALVAFIAATLVG